MRLIKLNLICSNCFDIFIKIITTMPYDNYKRLSSDSYDKNDYFTPIITN